MSALTTTEQRELQQHEHVIKSGLETFSEVGNALMAIRDSKLYRVSHKTFEDYCREKWGMSKRHADRLVGSAEVVSNLRPMGLTPHPCGLCGNYYNPDNGHICPKGGTVNAVLPQSERQARPLTKLPATEQPAAWNRAQEIAKSADEPVRARHVEQAVVEAQETKQVLSGDGSTVAARIKQETSDNNDRATAAIAELRRIPKGSHGSQVAFDRVAVWISKHR